jgi:release factor glutamine methyltransferase
MNDAFTKRNLEEPRLYAEMILAHVLSIQRLALYLQPEREPTTAELTTLRALVARALKAEPVQYLIGEAWFYGLPFRVDPRVLIPRSCTEAIIDAIAADVRARNVTAPIIADICTGSGCIGLALASQLRTATLHLTDISPEALAVAADNLATLATSQASKPAGLKPLGVSGGASATSAGATPEIIAALAGALTTARRTNTSDCGGAGPARPLDQRVSLHQGNLLSALPASLKGTLTHLVSNPPYIPDNEWNAGQVSENVRLHEPHLALRAGPDGLQFVRPLLQQARAWLAPGGMVMVEIAAATAPAAADIARTAGLRGVTISKDLEGHDRFVVGHA